MLTLLFLLLMVLFVVSLVGAARRRRRAVEAQEEAARRAAGGAVDPFDGASPFEGFPFGSLLESLMTGAGARSFRYDEATGEWVEMSEDLPTAEVEELRAPAADGASRKRARRARVQPHSTSALGPFGDLMGNLGGMGGSGQFEVESPEELSTFDDVGGMEDLKQEVRQTVGLMLEHPDDAERYGIEWNGILLHGPPGVGKTFFARAIAGEYGLSLMHVSTGDLVGGIVGQSAQNIDKAFETALQHLPCVLRLHTTRMPTVNVSLEDVARQSEGLSPADLKALTQEAALAAMTRADDPSPAIVHDDFVEALERHRTGATAREATSPAWSK